MLDKARVVRGEVYQFFSKLNIQIFPSGVWTTSPAGHPEITFKIDYQVCNRPFAINFAHIIPSKPSIGACEFIDPCLDKYLSRRWPKCIRGTATIEGPSSDMSKTPTLKEILRYLRTHLWTRKDTSEYTGLIKQNIDQTATITGYRREYFNRQLFDIDGERRPSSTRFYMPTDISDYIGPGLAFLPDVSGIDSVNEMVWSWIIPFKNRKNLSADFPALEEKIDQINYHFNSYSELEDAKQSLEKGYIKGCVRAAATAVEVILRYYCTAWEVEFPDKKHMEFDKKIEYIFRIAGKPSYMSVDSGNLQRLLDLKHAENSSHKGKCCYKDASGNIVHVKTQSQAEGFVTAAEDFALWIDSVV